MYFKDLDISFHYPVNHVTYCRAPEEDLYLKQPEIHFFNFLFLRMKFILKSVLHFKKNYKVQQNLVFARTFFIFWIVSTKNGNDRFTKLHFFLF